ncbi:hypothetical protein ISCGN_017234 [Ixodes scapularis]
MSTPSRQVDTITSNVTALGDVMVEPFSEEEIKLVLKATHTRTAPGPDGLNLKEIRKVPAAVLDHLFTNWLSFSSVPVELKVARTVFIPKFRKATVAGDFRPITISSLLLRLYTKAGKKTDRRSFCALSLNVLKAFDTVSHHAIIEVLEGRGLPPEYIEVVRDFYADSSTTFWAGGKTDGVKIPVRQGIKQGDPLFPFLFNCVLDPLLIDLNRDAAGLDVGSQTIGALAFTDDRILMSSSNERLWSLLATTETYLAELLSNTWLQPDTHHLKDGDRIKALRLRTNILPTNALLQRHNTDASARLCRRCRRALETSFHILQECPSIKLPRVEERHQFLCKQVCRLTRKYHTGAIIKTERVYHTQEGDRLKPDIAVTIDDTVVIADVAVACDDRPASRSRICAFKSAKYDCLRPLFPVKVTTAVGLAFGARSMLCTETLSEGVSLGIPKWDMAWLSSRALVGSLICFNQVMTS